MPDRLPPFIARFCACLRGFLLWLLPVALLCFGYLGPGTGRASAEATVNFKIIVHPENPVSALDREFVADAFLKRTTRWSGGEVLRPVDQASTSSVRQKFSDGILRRSVAAVKNYWQQRIFSGRDLPPPELDSDEAVVRYVVSHRGALGYVSGDAKLDKVRLVAVR